jgi:hypothetical protein
MQTSNSKDVYRGRALFLKKKNWRERKFKFDVLFIYLFISAWLNILLLTRAENLIRM